MELLTIEVTEQLPPLYSTEGIELEEKTAIVKFFTPDSNWTWYAVEYDGNDLFFGYVVGFVGEWGYFSLSELKSVRGPLGLPIERDLHFDPQPIKPYLTK